MSGRGADVLYTFDWQADAAARATRNIKDAAAADDDDLTDTFTTTRHPASPPSCVAISISACVRRRQSFAMRYKDERH